MHRETLLGIDVGSSSVKVCAYDRQGRLLGRSSRALQMRHPHPLWAEMDADEIWRETALAVRETLTGRNARVAAIGVSSACPTTIFLDAADRPLRPAILYLDHRSLDVIRNFSAVHSQAGHFALAGNRPGCSTSWLGNLVWLREQEPETWQKTAKVTLLGGYLTLRMTGNAVIDWSQASYSGGFRVARPEAGWDADLCARWDVDPALLAPVGHSCLPAGKLGNKAARDMGIEPGATVAFGAADTAAAAFALGLREAGEVFESAGTSGVITFCLDAPVFDDAFMNRCHIFPQRWLAHGAMSTLGGAFAWLRNNVWPDLADMRELDALAAASPPGANGLIFLPYLAGERSPIWDPEASALWLGLRMDNDRRDMARAVFEGTAFGLRQIFERGKAFWNCSPQKMLAVGGGARSELWTAVKSDILGLDYHRADDPDAAAWGAALTGGIAAGIFTGAYDSAIRFIPAAPVSAPEQAPPAPALPQEERRARYATAFAVYQQLYPLLQNAMHTLHTCAGEGRSG